jgi:hypothetical protein
VLERPRIDQTLGIADPLAAQRNQGGSVPGQQLPGLIKKIVPVPRIDRFREYVQTDVHTHRMPSLKSPPMAATPPLGPVGDSIAVAH